MSIATRKLDHNTFFRAKKFLQQAGEKGPDGGYCYMLKPQDGVGTLDAYIYMMEGKIIIARIWLMEFGGIGGRLTARNLYGERGCDAKILCEKYFNRFLEHLASTDIDDIEERQQTFDVIEEKSGKVLDTLLLRVH